MRFAGSARGIENKLVPREGYPLDSIEIIGLSRSMSPKGIMHNLKAAKLAVSAVAKAKKMLREARPDCVIGCGGYASFAVVRAAQQLGIPTVLLEVNALPGKVTQMLAKDADRVLVCFEQAKDDNELLNMLNSTFGTNISAEDFSHLMSVISNTVIDIDLSNTDKNNLDLVKWAQMAYDNKWGYVWGSHGNVLTANELKRLEKTFGSHVTDKEEYIKSHWLGRRTSDCVGLIKGYGWYDETSGTIKYGANGMKDVTADGMFNAAVEKGPISTMPDIPGIAVWHQGHIGVYIGNGYVIHAANTYDGVIKTPITSSGWTHWLKVPYINYIEETDADSN